MLATEVDPTTTPGWFHHGAKILELVEQVRPTVCVELGTWLGASAIPVACAIRRWQGTLTCIDTWAGDVRPTGVRTNAAPWMLVSCARNIMDAGLGPTIRLIPATTQDAALSWTQPIDYLYIDAAHDYASVRADLHAWVPHVRPGGVMLGDDYGSHLFPGVKTAWDEFAVETGALFQTYQSDPPDRDGVQLVYGIKE